jgi:hypothetical protein
VAADVAEVIWYQEDSTPPFTVLKPAAFGAGQLLVFVIHQDTGVIGDLTAPTGWTICPNTLDLTVEHGKVMYHAYDPADPSSWDFPYGSGIDAAACLLRITGADVDLPVVVVPTPTGSASNTASMNSPTVTPTGGDDLLIVTFGHATQSAVFSVTPPAGMTDRGKVQVTGNFQDLAAASEQLVSGSATGTRSWTSISPTGKSAGAFSIAVKSAGLFDPDPPSPGQVFLMPPWLMRELVLERQLPTRGDIGAPQVREVLRGGASGANITLTTGAGTAVDDLLVAFHADDFYTAAGLLTPTGTAGTWALQATGDDGTNEPHMKVWTRAVTVPGAQTVTVTPNSPALDNEHTLQLFVVSGADLVTVADSAAGGNGAATAAPVAPSTTAVATGDLLLSAVANHSFPTTFTAPPTMANRGQIAGGVFMVAAAASSEIGGPGVVGTRTWASTVSSTYASASILIRPAAGVVVGGTSAPADIASGTGAALDAGIAVAVNAEAPAGAGAAGDVGAAVAANAECAAGTGLAGDAAVAVSVSAECATGTGAALDATAATATSTEAASGIGTAQDPGPVVAVNADVAAGTGTAFDATTTSSGSATSAPADIAAGTGAALDGGVQVTVNAEAPGGTGVAFDAPTSVGTSAGPPSGTGVALDAGTALAVNAEATVGTGVALDAAASVAVSAGSSAGTGSALDSGPAVTVNAEAPSGTGTANDATISTATFTNANAECATGAGTAGDPTSSVAPSVEAAAATSVAGQPTIALSLSAEAALGVGAALAPVVTSAASALAEVASGSGSAGDPLADVRLSVGVATGVGLAFDLAATASGTALAELAAGLGTAYGPTASIAAAYLPILVGMDGGITATGSLDGSASGGSLDEAGVLALVGALDGSAVAGGLDSGVPLTVGLVE